MYTITPVIQSEAALTVAGIEEERTPANNLFAFMFSKIKTNWYRPGMQDVLTFTILARVGTFLSFILIN